MNVATMFATPLALAVVSLNGCGSVQSHAMAPTVGPGATTTASPAHPTTLAPLPTNTANPHHTTAAGATTTALTPEEHTTTKSPNVDDPTSPPPGEDSYDVIIVGSGLTGSAFAGMLVEGLGSDKRILMLEAGHASHHHINTTGAGHVTLNGDADGVDPPASCLTDHCAEWPNWHADGGTRWDVPGNYPELPCWDTQCPHAWRDFPSYQCKVLGGCGVSNGALMQHPSPSNFDSWPDGWQFSNLESYYQDVAKRFTITRTPSADGKHYLDDTGADKLRNALRGEGFTDRDDDFDRPFSHTMGVPKVAAKNGERQSTANVMLSQALNSSNFNLQLDCEVRQIFFEEGRATGVQYNHDGVSQTATLSAGGRVVLAAGAFNTPRVLLNSGVGPGLHIDNQGVGRGISDHTITSVRYGFPSDDGIKTFNYDPPSAEAISQYLDHRSGPLAQYGPTLAAFMKTGDHEGDIDVEMFTQPSNPGESEVDNELEVFFILMKPDCSSADLVLDRGGDIVTMTGSDGVHLPCSQDREKLVGAISVVTTALGKAAGSPVPGQRCGVDANTLCNDNMNHWAGSCKLGSCVDTATLLVHGTDNVAVVDASILPTQIWGHPALTLKAIAAKAADIVADQLRTTSQGIELV